MANDRLYLQCVGCNDTFFFAKFYPSEHLGFIHHTAYAKTDDGPLSVADCEKWMYSHVFCAPWSPDGAGCSFGSKSPFLLITEAMCDVLRDRAQAADEPPKEPR